MKTLNKLVGYALVVLCAAAIIVGCAMPVITKTPDGAMHTNYVANTTATQLATQVQAAAPVIGAVVPQPYGAMTALALTLAGLLGTTTAGGIAVYQNKRKNEHLSTIQAIGAAIEGAVPSIQEALTVTTSSGIVSNSNDILNQANTALTAVKEAVHSATVANNTSSNLTDVLSTVGAGPKAL